MNKLATLIFALLMALSPAAGNSQTSPNGELRIESVAMSAGEPSGLYSLTENRIINVSTGEVLWSAESYSDNKYIWSGDSRYVTVEYSGRQWTETDVIDTETYEIIKMPSIDDILKIAPDCAQPDSNVPMPLFKAVNWVNPDVVLMSFEWTANEDTVVSGEYAYNITDKAITRLTLNDEYQRG